MNTRPGIPTAVRNLSSTRRWRLSDVMNWHQLLQPLRQFGGESAGLGFYRLAYDLFTRFEIDYRPSSCDEPFQPPASRTRQRKAGDVSEPRVGLFVDAIDHTSGVSTTLTRWADEARSCGHHLRIFTAGHNAGLPDTRAFPAMGTLRVPLYAGLELAVPRVRDVLDYLDGEHLDVLHISTPGPMGLLGLLVAWARNLPVVGTYHTDFPSYAARLSEQPNFADPVWSYMLWFYGSMDLVAAPSASTRRELLLRGMPPRRVRVVGRGVDTSSFSPSHRDEGLRAKWGLKYPHKLLYVGRVSEEKNLGCLVDAFKRICRHRHDMCLVVVGEGPYQEHMARELAGLPVVFTGLRRGEDLSRHYASGDLFVFPSETDTFGVVVIEAQASGLPVIVSSSGGSRDLVRPGENGRVVRRINPERLAEAIEETVDDPARLADMRAATLRSASGLTPSAAFDAFWSLHREVHTHRSKAPGSIVTPSAPVPAGRLHDRAMA